MLRIIALAAAIAAPLPSVALSCLPYSHTQAYLDVADSQDKYVVVSGLLDFDSGLMPRTEGVTDAKPATFPGHVLGESLGQDGFIHPFDRDISITVVCAASWCGALDAGHDYLLFLRKDGGKYFLEQGLCNPHAFLNPTTDMENDVQTCLQGGACATSN